MLLSGSVLQNRDLAGKHRGYRHFCCLFLTSSCLGTRSSSLSLLLLSRYDFCWQGTLPNKTMFKCHVSFERIFFKNCQIFVDHKMTLQFFDKYTSQYQELNYFTTLFCETYRTNFVCCSMLGVLILLFPRCFLSNFDDFFQTFYRN